MTNNFVDLQKAREFIPKLRASHLGDQCFVYTKCMHVLKRSTSDLERYCHKFIINLQNIAGTYKVGAQTAIRKFSFVLFAKMHAVVASVTSLTLKVLIKICVFY